MHGRIGAGEFNIGVGGGGIVDEGVLWSYPTPRRFLTVVASLERETRQEQDGSKVSSLTFRPLKYLPTYF